LWPAVRQETVTGNVNTSFVDFDIAVRPLARFDERWPGLAERLITSRRSINEAERITQIDADDAKIVVECGTQRPLNECITYDSCRIRGFYSPKRASLSG
jgi:hypothetical protein